jgi:alpha-tubulin suppressor-like RCC1 family protein
VVEIAAQGGAGARTCARLEDGSVSCWGSQEKYGGAPRYLAGDGTSDRSLCTGSQVTVRGISDAIGVAIGRLNACVLRKDGTVWCWGDNTAQQLGAAALDSGPVRVRM